MKSIKYLILAGLLLVPLAGRAQYRRDRDWDRDRDYRSGDLNDIADGLSDSAQHAWSMVRGRRDDRDDQNVYLYDALRNFARHTRNWAAAISSSDPDTYRSGAQQLITEAQNISDLVDRTETTYHLRNDWNQVEDQVYRLSRFYGIPFSPDARMSRYYRGYGRDHELARAEPYYRGDNGYGYQSGTFRWSGRVDGSDIIFLRGNQVNIRHLQWQPITNASYDLPVPLPRTDVNVQLRQLRGRGSVQLIQQPSWQNDYTAAVRIDDPEAGQDYYEFELSW